MKRTLLTSLVVAGAALLPATSSDRTAVAAPSLDATAMHLELTKSVPEADEMLMESPSRITLWFTQAPQMAGTSVRVLPKGADAPLDLGDPRAHEDDPTVVSLDVPIALAAGEYVIHWRAMAQDGHVVRGDFGFMVHAER